MLDLAGIETPGPMQSIPARAIHLLSLSESNKPCWWSLNALGWSGLKGRIGVSVPCDATVVESSLSNAVIVEKLKKCIVCWSTVTMGKNAALC